MSSLKGYELQIAHGGHGITAIEEYARERTDQLTRVCVSTESSIEQIRVAQAGIAEMELILTMRDRLKAQMEDK